MTKNWNFVETFITYFIYSPTIKNYKKNELKVYIFYFWKYYLWIFAIAYVSAYFFFNISEKIKENETLLE